MIPDFYTPIESYYGLLPDDFHTCPDCLTKPRLWIFDNGEQAKCNCNDTYDAASAYGICIWDYHKLHNGDMSGWNHNDLMNNWNKVAKERELNKTASTPIKPPF